MGRKDPIDVTKPNADKRDDHLSFCDEKSSGSGKGGGGSSSGSEYEFGGSKFSATGSSCCGADAVDTCLNKDIVPKLQGRKPIDKRYGAWGATFKDRDTFTDMHLF